jgi:hypothetical protein
MQGARYFRNALHVRQKKKLVLNEPTLQKLTEGLRIIYAELKSTYRRFHCYQKEMQILLVCIEWRGNIQIQDIHLMNMRPDFVTRV